MSKPDEENKEQGFKPPSNPKVYCFMAREAYTAVVLYRRRGKETWVFKINYADENGQPKSQIEKGARFNGKFYPQRCDLSPDGKHFAYFVMGGYQRGKSHDEHLYCWNAMSKPPALTAEFLLPQQSTRGGGAIFYDNANLYVEAGMYSTQEELADINGKNFLGVTVWAPGYTNKVAPELANRETIADGWEGELARNMIAGEWTKKSGDVVLKSRFHDDWQEIGHYGSMRYQLLDADNDPILSEEKILTANWADFDLMGRLWLGVESHIEIFDNPDKGMSDKPGIVIDLEAQI